MLDPCLGDGPQTGTPGASSKGLGAVPSIPCIDRSVRIDSGSVATPVRQSNAVAEKARHCGMASTPEIACCGGPSLDRLD